MPQTRKESDGANDKFYAEIERVQPVPLETKEHLLVQVVTVTTSASLSSSSNYIC
jgi:hypothetical protein